MCGPCNMSGNARVETAEDADLNVRLIASGC